MTEHYPDLTGETFVKAGIIYEVLDMSANNKLAFCRRKGVLFRRENQIEVFETHQLKRISKVSRSWN